MLDHEAVLLGDSFNAIMQATAEYVPNISQYQFEREVLDLLSNPFSKEALTRYLPYVGELTKQLNVVDQMGMILFTIPAFVQTPRPTMAKPDGITAEHFFRNLQRDVDLGGRHVSAKIVEFMDRITFTPDYHQAVVEPIRQILARYGRTYQIQPTQGQPAALGQPVAVTLAAPVSTSSFSDEYED